MGQTEPKCNYTNTFSSRRFTISVLSYNVLADCYTTNRYFPKCDPRHLQFETRLNKIQNFINEQRPSIICLQEVDRQDSYDLAKYGYAVLYHQRPGRLDGCLVGYQREIFSVGKYMTYSLDDLSKQYGPTYQRQNVFQIVELVHIHSKQRIFVGNIHVYWDPRVEEVKFFQIAMFVKEMERASNKNKAIICGDFNSLPQSNILRYILEGAAPEKELSESKNSFESVKGHHKDITIGKWQSAYDCQQVTNFQEKFKGCIDYILFNDFHVSETLDLPSEELLKPAIPNQIFPSDHLPLLASLDFYIK